MDKEKTKRKYEHLVREDKKLKEEILQIILKSGKSFGVVMRTLEAVRWYLISKTETFLENTEIGKVSESPETPYIRYLPEIMDKIFDKHHEVRK